jgi:ribosomal protein L18E
MNFLTPDDLNALIELVETNNQYNHEDDKEFWDDVLIRLNQTRRHCLDV